MTQIFFGLCVNGCFTVSDKELEIDKPSAFGGMAV